MSIAVLDARPVASGELAEQVRARGVRVLADHAIAKVKGGKAVTSVAICRQEGDGTVHDEIACDCVAMSGGWSPVVHLWSHTGGKLTWDAERAMFKPDAARPPLGDKGQAMVRAVGAANGALRRWTGAGG